MINRTGSLKKLDQVEAKQIKWLVTVTNLFCWEVSGTVRASEVSWCWWTECDGLVVLQHVSRGALSNKLQSRDVLQDCWCWAFCRYCTTHITSVHHSQGKLRLYYSIGHGKFVADSMVLMFCHSNLNFICDFYHFPKSFLVIKVGWTINNANLSTV